MKRVVRVQPGLGKPVGWISWAEHLEAHAAHVRLHGWQTSAERMAIDVGGFTYEELVVLLGHEPTSWEPSNLSSGS